MQEDLRVISTDDEIDQLIVYLQGFDYAAFDSETTGLSLSAEIIGLSVACEENLGWYVITAVWDTGGKELVKLPNRDKVLELLNVLKLKQLITHNGWVDFQWTNRNYGIQLKESLVFDTMISSHLLDENARSHALKERGVTEFGETATQEQQEMKASVLANGGRWEEKRGGEKDMFMADPYIIARYGAKDSVLTFKLFLLDIVRLDEQGLTEYFHTESMPLFRGPTYDLNTAGLKVDTEQLKALGEALKLEINDLKAEILADIAPYVKDEYPGTKKTNTFNIGSSSQLSWLLFIKLDNKWKKLTNAGRTVATDLVGRVPYSDAEKRRFNDVVNRSIDAKGRPLKLQRYIQCDKIALLAFAEKYKWCKNLLKYSKAKKLLNTYVEGILGRVEYGVIHPSFGQIGTTGTRYSSKNPNFQNLPRDDKRIKKCIIARPGKVFVGADQSQIEARVFASLSGDEGLMKSFERGEDFYSIIGMQIFKKYDCLPLKEGHPDAFGIKYKKQRQIAKGICLAATYGATAFRLSDMLGLTVDECKQIIADYFEAYPSIRQFMLNCHRHAIEHGYIRDMFGRYRRIPEAMIIKSMGDDVQHEDLPYAYRTPLNLSVNASVQMPAGSIVNRSSIAVLNRCAKAGLDVKMVVQVHDQVVLECWEADRQQVAEFLQEDMEQTCTLPGVKLEAKPFIAYNLGDLG